MTSISSKLIHSSNHILIPLIARRKLYKIETTNIMEELSREAEELRSIEREVKEKVTRAKELGEKIEEEVYIWLEEAHNIGMKVATTFKPKSKFNKLFPCCHSKEHVEDVHDVKKSVKDLVEQGRKYIFLAKGIELVWRDGFADFRSRRSTFARIMESLEDDHIGIIGISGLGGIGKTRLVTEIGKKANDEQLFDQVLMATVSQYPDIRNIQQTLADMLDLKFKDDDETSRASELRSRLERESKVLVIMDDVWEVINMYSVGVPPYSNQKGCKIVITTRREKVCKDMSCNLVIPLGVINYDDAWDLFREYADLKDNLSTKFVAKAGKIVRECGGLPLAVIVVGNALRGKDFEDYEDALQRLSSSSFVNIESADREIYSCLKLSYDYLKDEDTKRCFLLCSVFPEDSRIFVKELMRYAHGQCLFQNVSSVDETRMRIFSSVEKLEDAGLLSRVISLKQRKGNYFQTWPVVKMHDLVRDFALWIAKGNGASSFVLTPSNKERWVREYKNATAMYLRRFELNWQFPNKVVCPNMKILIISSYLFTFSFENISVAETFFEVTSAIQVLDMHSSTNVHHMLPPIWLETLINLRSLRLDGNAFLRSKDMYMIGKLKNLEILELNLGSQETLLPECIGELCNLRLLDLSKWNMLKVIPCNLLPRLTKLEELYTPAFHKRQWDTHFLSDLKFLPRLTAFYGQFMGFQSFPDDSRFENLQRYYINCRLNQLKDEDIRWTRSLGLDDVNELSKKAFEKLLPGVECLKIVKRDLSRASGFENMCPQIDNAGFQNLRELYLECIDGLEYLIDTTGSGLGLPSLTTAFPNLVQITLENLTLLRKMCHGKLPSSCLAELRKVAIKDCQKLENIVPHMLPIGSKLEELKIEECRDSLRYVYDLVDGQSAQHTQLHQQSLPCPKVLKLDGLFHLQSIWNVPLQLEFVDKHNDAELCKLTVRCLESLVIMKIHRSLDLDEVFPCVELNNQRSDAQLSNLVELDLQFLPKLKCIWKGYQQNYSLKNLARIKLDECHTLTSIFTSTHAQSLQKLQYLVIKNCTALETIVTPDEQDEAMRVSRSSSLPKSFQEIKEIDISSCNKLHTVLPISFVAMNLPKLESIDIKDCAELEQVFGDNGQENVAEGRQLVMNKLKDLMLVNLPSLGRFAPLNCSVFVSSLSQMVEQDYSEAKDLLNFLPRSTYESHTWRWLKD